MNVNKKMSEGLLRSKYYGDLTMDVFDIEEICCEENTLNEMTIEEISSKDQNMLETTVCLTELDKPRVFEKNAILFSPLSKVIHILDSGITKIGRDKFQCDIVISNRAVSAVHATIIWNEQGIFVRDESSMNGTTVNGKTIEARREVFLNEASIIMISDEVFYFVYGEKAKELIRSKQCEILECEETEEIMPLIFDRFMLGRANPWPNNTFGDMHASRNHGYIYSKNGEFMLKVSDRPAKNGTFLNENYVEPNEEITLKNNDIIGIGNSYHIRFKNMELL